MVRGIFAGGKEVQASMIGISLDDNSDSVFADMIVVTTFTVNMTGYFVVRVFSFMFHVTKHSMILKSETFCNGFFIFQRTTQANCGENSVQSKTKSFVG